MTNAVDEGCIVCNIRLSQDQVLPNLILRPKTAEKANLWPFATFCPHCGGFLAIGLEHGSFTFSSVYGHTGNDERCHNGNCTFCYNEDAEIQNDDERHVNFDESSRF